MATEPLETAAGNEFPVCRQISIFLENRVGQLLRLTRLFDNTEIRIRAVSVEGSIDCSIVRLIVDDPDLAISLREAGFPLTETDVLVVELPIGKRGMLVVCAALIAAEVNINYVYPLWPGPDRGASMAIQVDNLTQAAHALSQQRFRIIDQPDL